MGKDTRVEWATHEFSPWQANGQTRVVAPEGIWKEPLQWDRNAKALGVRHRVYCSPMADVFEDWPGPIQDSAGKILIASPLMTGHNGNWPLTMQHVRQRIFELIDQTPNLDWLLLTKRPENIAAMMPQAGFPSAGVPGTLGRYLVPNNVWLGTTVENQATADERIPHLLRVPAKVRFLSCEPLLGQVILPDEFLRLGKQAWAIAGGESGPHARPSHPDWFRSLQRQCTAAGVPYFHKQNGEWWASAEHEGQQAFRQFASKTQWVNKAQTWMSTGDICLDADGRECKCGADFETARCPVTIMRRVGKAAAGRLLDSREWNEVPS